MPCARGTRRGGTSGRRGDAVDARPGFRPSKSTKRRPTCGFSAALPSDRYVPFPSQLGNTMIVPLVETRTNPGSSPLYGTAAPVRVGGCEEAHVSRLDEGAAVLVDRLVDDSLLDRSAERRVRNGPGLSLLPSLVSGMACSMAVGLQASTLPPSAVDHGRLPWDDDPRSAGRRRPPPSPAAALPSSAPSTAAHRRDRGLAATGRPRCGRARSAGRYNDRRAGPAGRGTAANLGAMVGAVRPWASASPSRTCFLERRLAASRRRCG